MIRRSPSAVPRRATSACTSIGFSVAEAQAFIKAWRDARRGTTASADAPAQCCTDSELLSHSESLVDDVHRLVAAGQDIAHGEADHSSEIALRMLSRGDAAVSVAGRHST